MGSSIILFAFVCLHMLMTGHALECDTCQKMGNMEPNCVTQTCMAGMDRCLAMTFSAAANGQKMSGWIKQCNVEALCNYGESRVCDLMKVILSGSGITDFSGCGVACSTSNDVQIPQPGGNAAGIMTVNVVTVLLTLFVVIAYTAV